MTCLRSVIVGILASMILAGLVSVTFRQLDVAAIITLTRDTGLRGITWGGDIHVPSGNLAVAREAGKMTTDAGLWTEAYGSYYAAGAEPEKGRFERDLETAIALGAPRIRLWAGKQESRDATEKDRERVTEDLRRCAAIARAANVAVALEFHSHSLTDTAESAASLIRTVNQDGANVRLYWQPPNGMAPSEALAGLRLVQPWVDNFHVFHWSVAADGELLRHPLAEGRAAWMKYVSALQSSGSDRWAMLEFVKGDDPAQLRADAAELRRWLENRFPD